MIYSPIYYLQTNIFCIIVFVLLLVLQNRHSKTNTTETALIKRMIYLTVVYCVSDIGAWFSNGATFVGSLFILIISNIIYILLPAVFIYIWVQYVYYRIYNKDYLKSGLGQVMVVPLVIMIVLGALNPLTKFLFTIDEDNVYHRGIGAYCLPVLCLIYLIYSLVAIALYIKNEQNKIKREATKPLLIFGLPIIIAAAVQLTFYGLTVNQIGFTLTIVMMYLNLQYEKISVDELTGLNNSRELKQYLYGMINNERAESLFCCMIDVDFFKTINDNYGHVEGDKALKAVSRVLKNVCGAQKQRMFLARYGGDEFVISGINTDLHELDTLKQQLMYCIKEENETSKTPYKLSLSIGYAICNPREISQYDEILKLADAEMYKVKKKRVR